MYGPHKVRRLSHEQLLKVKGSLETKLKELQKSVHTKVFLPRDIDKYNTAIDIIGLLIKGKDDEEIRRHSLISNSGLNSYYRLILVYYSQPPQQT